MVINESYIYEVNSFDTLQDFLPTLQDNLCSELPLPQDVEDGVTAPPFDLRGPSLEIFNSTSRVDLRSGGRGFDSRPCHAAIALGKQFTLTFPSPPTCKTGTWPKAVLEICEMLVFERLTGCRSVML
ncbi:hypothetical protein ElyMa_002558900 [Elysia marginata]|uniref:Uncharacterized protein n=1 Tax=Elysia marginata TaxID=1093978 RepID=A0AAV4GX40_9GAST|nr:hypothetical protein ElyMa_002558900 [Elysia marginata]